MNMDLLLCRRHYSHKIFLLWMTLQCLLRALFLLYLIKIYCWDIVFSIFYAKNYQVCLGSQTQITLTRFQQRLVLLLSRIFFLFSYLFCIPCGKKKIWVMPPPRAPEDLLELGHTPSRIQNSFGSGLNGIHQCWVLLLGLAAT